MINFRYHLVSLVGIFLALGIGVIMGTAVIDSAVVDRLESQQRDLEDNIEDVVSTNDELRARVRDLDRAADELAGTGAERLLDLELLDVPVMVVALAGAEREVVGHLVSLLGTADAEYAGTMWLTDRFVLDDDDERADLADVLGLSRTASATALRASAVTSVADAIRTSVGGASDTEPGADGLWVALQDAGFISYEPPPGDGPDDALTIGTRSRFVIVTDPDTAVPAALLGLPLVRALVGTSPSAPTANVVVAATELATEGSDEGDEERPQGLVEAVRDDDDVSGRVSTVDRLDAYGAVATVLALDDLGGGRYGHYGRGPGAQGILPPAEADG